MNYKEANDYELVFLVKEQNEEAEKVLIRKYENLIAKIIQEYKNIIKYNGLDKNDLYQEGLLGLMYAIENFNETRNASFYTYASICIKSKMKTLIRKSTNTKNYMLNNSLSLDNINSTEENNYYCIIANNTDDLSTNLSEAEERDILFKSINKILTPLEKEVLDYKIKNYTNEEISVKMNKEKRCIENAITRIRKKYKKIKE